MIRITTALVILVGAGLAHGAWTNRWRASPELTTLTSKFESVPRVIGEWQGTDLELPSRERTMAGALACLARRYTSPSRGISISVLLIGGLPGNISVHTPDICYPGAGYTLNEPTRYDFHAGLGGRPASFRTALATRGGTSPSTLRIFWSWNAATGWLAPDEPRWKFASEPSLAKLYVIRDTAGAAVEPSSDPCNDFMSAFLPELDRVGFSHRE